MTDPISLYLPVVLLGAVLTVLVGALLYRDGAPFLDEVFDDPARAASVNRLLVVLFYLFMLGILGVISVFDVPWADGGLQIVLTKLGVVSLVLGIAHGIVMMRFSRLRSRRRSRRVGRAAVRPAG